MIDTDGAAWRQMRLLEPGHKSVEDSENLPEPDVLAQEIADDLQTALEQFAAIAAELTR